MTRNPLVIDLALALLAAILLLIIAPGIAVAGLIGLLVLIFSVVSFARQSRKRRPRAPTRVRRHPPQRD